MNVLLREQIVELRNIHFPCMVVKNQLWNDVGVMKEAIGLSDAGFSVTIIAGTEKGCPSYCHHRS